MKGLCNVLHLTVCSQQMWLIITKHQYHDPLAWQLLVLLFVVTSALFPILSVKSNQSCYIVRFRPVFLSFWMHFVLFLELLICLFSCLFSPICCVVFSPCHVLFLITSGRFLHPHLLIKSANRQVNNFILPHKLLRLTCLPSAQNIFIQTESSSLPLQN